MMQMCARERRAFRQPPPIRRSRSRYATALFPHNNNKKTLFGYSGKESEADGCATNNMHFISGMSEPTKF